MKLDGVSLKKSFWRFILPSVAAQWIFALYTMVDGMFVARGVSEVALSAVNIASPYVNFLFSVSILFAVGASTMVAVNLGKGDHAQANRIYSQNMVVVAVVSLLIMAGMWLFLDEIAGFLGATPLTMPFVKEYILSILPFSWCFIIAYSFEILVKTDGYPHFATIAVTTGALLNCLLDYLFVIVWKWGAGGAGFATGLSQLVLVVIYLWHFLSPRATIHFVRFPFVLSDVGRTIKLGLSSGLTEFSAGITVFLFNHTILRYIGEQGLISYTIVAYVSTIVVMSLAGIAQGIQPLISFYYGRGDQLSCRTLLRYGTWASIGLGAISCVGVLVGAEWVVGLFVSPALVELRTYSAAVFRVFSLAFLVMGLNVIVSGYFTAVEMPRQSLAISLGRGFVTIFLALQACTLLFGGTGVWWAAMVSEVICLIVTGALFYRYRRKGA